ncbi:hypothetical protein [Chitinophaga sp. Cy-1792]|uniref:hypothetical protein n=1 Tax=Chitinophaga sp. Cy-1792 TaxID=2608339 RepID=UPI00141E297C|nr:hypothetical protein [Chitinophaga sp. Cy-1792]NIG56574.1 hypothetical protein [Chitinophaga sp. Cy-1792]
MKSYALLLLTAVLLVACSKNNPEAQLETLKKGTSSVAAVTTQSNCTEVFFIPGGSSLGSPNILTINGTPYQVRVNFIDFSNVTPVNGAYKVFSNCNIPNPQDPVKLRSDSLVNDLANALDKIFKGPAPQPVPPTISEAAYMNAFGTTPYVGDGAAFVSKLYNTYIALDPKVPKLPAENALFTATMVVASPYFKKVKLDYLVEEMKDEAVCIVCFYVRQELNLKTGKIEDMAKITLIDGRASAPGSNGSGDPAYSLAVASANGPTSINNFFSGQSAKAFFYKFSPIPRT